MLEWFAVRQDAASALSTHGSSLRWRRRLPRTRRKPGLGELPGQGRMQINGFSHPRDERCHAHARQQGRSLQTLAAEALSDALRKHAATPWDRAR